MQSSSTVEQAAVNGQVEGSNPSFAVNLKENDMAEIKRPKPMVQSLVQTESPKAPNKTTAGRKGKRGK